MIRSTDDLVVICDVEWFLCRVEKTRICNWYLKEICSRCIFLWEKSAIFLVWFLIIDDSYSWGFFLRSSLSTDFVNEIPNQSGNLTGKPPLQLYHHHSLGRAAVSTRGNGGVVGGSATVSRAGTTGRGGGYSVSNELEELTRKINGWKQQSQESFLRSIESKSLAGGSMRTLGPEDSMDGRKRVGHYYHYTIRIGFGVEWGL